MTHDKVKAAQYYAGICKDDGKWWVWMNDGEYHSAIQKCRSKETCDNAVLRWQLKENLSVQKENRRIEKLLRGEKA